MNKKTLTIIIVTLLILVGIFGIYNYQKSKLVKKENNVEISLKQNTEFPAGWTEIKTTSAVYKAERAVETGQKPEIILQKINLSTSTNFKTYTDKIISGAKSSLPSLVYLQDETDTFNEYARRTLSGSYKNQDNLIYVYQTVYQKGDEFFTLTASYTDKKYLSEIETIKTVLESEVLVPNKL